jgi:FkbM family methyltransferase
VTAFEPNPQLAQAIEKSCILNDLQQRIQVLPVGVGDVSARAQFKHLDEHNLGAQSIELSDNADAPLKVITLDSLNWEEPVRAIKIDVEGMELAVLNGARQLIKKDQPMLYVECQAETDFISIHQWLVDMGYVYWDTFNATPTHLFLHGSQVSSEQLQSHSLYQGARENYRTTVQQNELRKKLDASAQKYRIANDNISNLTLKLTEANEKYRHVGDALSDNKQKLTEANEKYRQTSSELGELKHQLQALKLDHSRSKLDRESLQTTLETSKQSIHSLEQKAQNLSEQLASANEKYRTATEQNLQLRAKIEQVSLKYDASVDVLSLTQDKLILLEQQSQAKLEQLQAQNEENLEHLQQRYEQHQTQSQVLKEQLSETEARVDELGAKKQRLTLQLDQANSKYRLATGEQIPLLKRQITDKAPIFEHYKISYRL